MSAISPAAEGDLTFFAAQMTAHDRQALLAIFHGFGDSVPLIDITLKQVMVTDLRLTDIGQGVDGDVMRVRVAEVEITRSTR